MNRDILPQSRTAHRTNQRSQSEHADTDSFHLYLRSQASKSDSPKSSENVFGDTPATRKVINIRTLRRSETSILRDGPDVDSSNARPSLSSTFTPDWEKLNRSRKSQHSIHQAQVHATDPPRPAQDGYEWVWFPQGYWAEREKFEVKLAFVRPHTRKRKLRVSRQKGNRPSSSPDSHDGDTEAGNAYSVTSTPTSPSKQDTIPRSYYAYNDDSAKVQISSPTQRLVKSLHLMSPTYPHFVSPTGEPEGLYCKTKRGLGSLSRRKKEPVDDSDPSLLSLKGLPSRTTMTLQGTASYFDQMHREQIDQYMMHNPRDSPPLDSKNRRKRFGLAPWHRQDSYDTIWSVSSSVRDILMSKTPVSTPSPEGIHTEVAQEEIRSEGDDNYALVTPELPTISARRVNTPPISNLSVDGRTRGFFFDFAPPGEASISNRRQSLSGKLREANFRNPSGSNRDLSSTKKREREWWEVDIPASARREDIPSKRFILDIPEHLPNSPLCPMNPKHKSGGTGVCVYHGRRLNPESSSDEL